MQKILSFIKSKALEAMALIICGINLFLWRLPAIYLWLYIFCAFAVLVFVDNEFFSKYRHTTSRYVSSYILELILLGIIIGLSLFWTISFPTGVTVATVYSLFVISINQESLRRSILSKILDIKRDPYYFILALLLICLLFIWEGISKLVFFSTFLLPFLFYRWNPRVLVYGAFFSASMTGVFLLSGHQVLAETIVEYSYFFLIIALALKVLENATSLQRLLADDRELNAE